MESIQPCSVAPSERPRAAPIYVPIADDNVGCPGDEESSGMMRVSGISS